MSPKRSLPHFRHFSRLLGVIFLIALTTAYVSFIPPTNVWLVIPLIILVVVLTSLISSFFLGKKFQILIGFFMLVFLTMNYLAGFQLMNILLLLTFILVLSLLFAEKT